jgi:hypothetical protein
MEQNVKTTRPLRAGVVFILCFLSTFLFPLLAFAVHGFLPRRVVNFLFFFPAAVLPYVSFVTGSAWKSPLLFTPTTGWTLNMLQWILVAAAFAWFGRRLKVRYIIPLAFVTIILVAIVVPLSFALLGHDLQVEGP